MRLLERRDDGSFSLTEDLGGNIPAYAILSHTWGNDDEEVTFKEMNEGSGKSKAGYQKIQFCGDQAARDGFRYCWVDTCCINKENSTELSEALNSMYRWYRDAARCYVYLADVSLYNSNSAKGLSQLDHEAFRKSRWFTRGWTLQELIAPQSIQFFSLERKLIGDKKSLERQIHEITGIAVSALQGTPLSEFSVEERFSWAKNRETKKEEDKAYSLLGIFGVFLPLIYGEGRDHAFGRLQEAVGRSVNSIASTKTLTHGVSSIRGHQILPFPRNTNFVGRESCLEQLTTELDPRRFAGICPWMALDGLGGVGKTQIALQFAYQIQDMAPECSVFWVQASDPASFDNSYREIAQRLGIPGLEDDKTNVKQLVVTALKGLTSPWMLIVDNADNYEMFSTVDDQRTSRALIEYLPNCGNGAVLFTTRDNKAATRFAEAKVIRVKAMSRQESIELLTNSIQVQKHSLLDDEASTTELLGLLLDLPLAIKQAAAYINENSTPISEYLSFYNKSEQEIIEVLSEDFEDHRRYRSQKNPVATTWLISFRQIERQDRLAAEYLSFIGVLLRDDIPISLLLPGKSLVEQKNAIGTLTAYSFITRRTGEEAFYVHRLVYMAIRNWLRIENKLLTWEDKAMNRLVEVIPMGGHTNREIWTKYLPHGIYLADTIGVRSDNKIALIKLLQRIGLCQLSAGQYIRAEQTHQRTLVINQETLGKEHRDTLNSMHNVAQALYRQGKSAEAEKLYRETLALRRKVLGEEHPHTLSSINNLAIVLSYQKKNAEAEKMYRETLALRRKVLVEEHPDTLTSMNNLAMVLSEQGKYAEAEKMHRETLALVQKVLGKEHPNTLASMNNLAMALSEQGKYAEAEKMYRETLALHLKALGEEHPYTLTSMNNFAGLLSKQGKYVEAEKMYREALDLRRKVLGEKHPSTLRNISRLAQVLSNQGKHAEAEKIRDLHRNVSGNDAHVMQLD